MASSAVPWTYPYERDRLIREHAQAVRLAEEATAMKTKALERAEKAEAEVERLNADLDHEAREHKVTHDWWMDAKAEAGRLREALQDAQGALHRALMERGSTDGYRDSFDRITAALDA